MKGPAGQAVVGGDWPNPLPVVTYGEPRRRPTGLDWAAISPPADETAPVLPSTHAEARDVRTTRRAEQVERVERLESKPAPRARAPKRAAAAPVPAPAAAPAEPAAAPAPEPEPRDQYSIEIRAVAQTLEATEGSDDMIVNACRATVISAADALRGAMLRAAEAGERASRPKEVAKTPRPKKDGRGNPRIEAVKPHLLETIRRRYVDDQAGIEVIAGELGMAANTIGRILHRNRIPVRSRKEANLVAQEHVRRRLAELGVTAMQVRLWAAEVGLSIGDRGVLPSEVLDRYEAHLTDGQPSS